MATSRYKCIEIDQLPAGLNLLTTNNEPLILGLHSEQVNFDTTDVTSAFQSIEGDPIPGLTEFTVTPVDNDNIVLSLAKPEILLIFTAYKQKAQHWVKFTDTVTGAERHYLAGEIEVIDPFNRCKL